MPTPDPAWDSLELRLLNTTDVFIHKPAIMKKAEDQLQHLNQTLQEFLKDNTGICPPEADIIKGQIARGENHKGFPFLSLDMPQLFSKQTFFTYRTLFWWGHYLGFSLILKGETLQPLVQTLASRTNGNGIDNILFCIAPTPWEWATTEDTHLPLNCMSGPELLSHWDGKGFVKLLKIYPMSDEGFAQLDWSMQGLGTFRDFIRLIGK